MSIDYVCDVLIFFINNRLSWKFCRVSTRPKCVVVSPCLLPACWYGSKQSKQPRRMNPARPRRRAAPPATARPRLRPLLPSSPTPRPPFIRFRNGKQRVPGGDTPATPACRARSPRLPAPGAPPASWPVRQVCPQPAQQPQPQLEPPHGSHSGRAPRRPDLSAPAARFTRNICGDHAGIPPED